VFLFTYWEDEIRPRLAVLKKVKPEKIHSDIMGDLRILRNIILHEKGIISSEKYKKLSKLADMFAINTPVHISYENMHGIFVLIKQDCLGMLYELRGIKDSSVQPGDIKDIAIQRCSPSVVSRGKDI
jgi:hypothetical protein